MIVRTVLPKEEELKLPDIELSTIYKFPKPELSEILPYYDRFFAKAIKYRGKVYFSLNLAFEFEKTTEFLEVGKLPEEFTPKEEINKHGFTKYNFHYLLKIKEDGIVLLSNKNRKIYINDRLRLHFDYDTREVSNYEQRN